MCQYQTLFHNDKIGYVIRCAECEKIQVGYSNMLLTFGMEDFEAFRSWLRKLMDEHTPPPSDTLRCILIPTPCEGMKLLLSTRELKDFNSMLEKADTELRSLAMIKLFSQ